MTSTRGATVVALALAMLGTACGEDQQPERARDLWARLQAMDYRSFDPAPGYEERAPSRAAHGDEVQVFVNDVVATALAGPPLDEWPEGSLIVKDGYEGGDLCFVAAMEKVDGEWFWVEYDEDGDTLFSGAPTLCTGCHRLGEDWVRAFFLP
jgi:hypothetical protein